MLMTSASKRVSVLLCTLCAGAALLPVAAGAAQLSDALSIALGQKKPTLSVNAAAMVNDKVISNYDLDQRVALFVATSGVRPTKDSLPQIRAQVLRTIEDEVLQVQEAQKHKIFISKAEVDRAIKNIADDNKVGTDEILATIRRAGVSENVFRQQIAAQITWQRVVTARFGTDVLITDTQVNEAMDRLRKGADKPQFLVSEIFIAVDKPEEEASVKASVDQIVTQLQQGAPFATVASQFSQSPSAADRGDIGWVIQGQLAEEIDNQLVKMRHGQISPAVRAEGGYYVLLVRDRKEPFGTNIEEMMEQMMPELIFDPDRAIPLDRLLIPLPPDPPADVKTRAMEMASGVHKQLRSCNDLPEVADKLKGTVYTKLGEMKPVDLARNLHDMLALTDPGQAVPPYYSDAGIELIMRCDPPVQRPVAFELPSREELQNQLFVQQMTILAKSYMRDLRRDAVIERR
jgi:peptidyl-prolyl cis-trans isomerase SurA